MGKGSVRLLTIIALFVLLAGSWYTIFTNAQERQRIYDEKLEIARELRTKKLYDDSFSAYHEALDLRDTLELREEILDYCKELNYIESYLSLCTNTITEYPRDIDAYERMAEYYATNGEYVSCYGVLNSSKKRNVSSSKLQKIEQDIKYKYSIIRLKYNNVRVFSSDLCAVQRRDGTWGYVSLTGIESVPFKYISVGEFGQNYAVVQGMDKKFVFIDRTGREKSKDLEEKEIEECGFLYEDKIPVKYNGKYHYCDFEFKELFGKYDYAGTFSGGFAVVMNNGKWHIIDANGNQVGNKLFDDIKVDEKGVAFRNGIAFAKENGKYILIDTQGNQVGNERWDDVDCFNSKQPAAVSKDGKWGYVDISGKMVLDYTYDCAKSFSYGFAAVQVQDKWGYIILDDYSLKIDCQFENARDFSRYGTAFVVVSGGWDLISIYSYYY